MSRRRIARFARRVSPALLLGLLAGTPTWSDSDTVRIRVTDLRSGAPLPCRLTVVDARGELAPLECALSPTLAIRPGVIYTATGEARFGLGSGRYTVFATRGPRYGLASATLSGDRPQDLHLQLEREVETPGYVSSDTHIHTLTFSGHGDCSAQERLVTLAGEDIELPIATEHNRISDYAPVAGATGTARYLTPVSGDEVTTTVGHFNVFPLIPGSMPPDFHSTDRRALLSGMRSVSPGGVVILNHPRDLHANFRAADPARFHPLSGESLDGQPWSFDGIEVINSGAQQSDWMQPYRDWFALLNHGERLIGVGSSDSHDVNRYLVGQGRTYLASRAARPDRIDPAEAVRSFRAGKALVSSGLFTEIWVNEQFTAGDLAPASGSEVKVRVRVRGPRWIRADRVALYGNGQLLGSRALTPVAGATTQGDVTFPIAKPRHDLWLVAIASGPGVTAPYWPLARPYQPTRADWEPRVIGSTSPIRLDADGDGRFESPQDYARSLTERFGASTKPLLAALGDYDGAVAVQVASLLRGKPGDLGTPAARALVDQAAPPIRQAVVAYFSHFGGRPD